MLLQAMGVIHAETSAPKTAIDQLLSTRSRPRAVTHCSSGCVRAGHQCKAPHGAFRTWHPARIPVTGPERTMQLYCDRELLLRRCFRPTGAP